MTSDASKTTGIDLAIKLLGGLVALLYVTGVVTVNTYLYKLGVSNFDLLKPRFVFTGAIVIMSIVGTYLCVFQATKGLHAIINSFRNTISGTMNHWTDHFTYCLLLIIGPFVWFSILTTWNSWALTKHNVWHSLSFYALALLVGGPAHLAIAICRGKPEKEREMEDAKWFIALTAALFSVIVSASFITKFATEIYPRVPEQFGGGRPQTVKILLDKQFETPIGTLGIQFEDEQGLSKPVKVLFDGENTLVIEGPRNEIIQLDKHITKALLVMGEQSAQSE